MANTRTKVASARIDGSTVTFDCWSDPERGEQRITAQPTYDTDKFPELVQRQLQAVGFASVAGNRYQRTNGHPDVASVTKRLYDEMLTGDWQPGIRASETEPTDLQLALAEATGQPVMLIQEQFENRMKTLQDGTLYRDARGRTHRFFDATMQARLSEQKEVKPILARIAAERAKRLASEARTAKSEDLVGSLFGKVERDEAAQ